MRKAIRHEFGAGCIFFYVFNSSLIIVFAFLIHLKLIYICIDCLRVLLFRRNYANRSDNKGLGAVNSVLVDIVSFVNPM